MTTSDELAQAKKLEDRIATEANHVFAHMEKQSGTLLENLLDNLTAVQARCTQQEEEIRALKRFTQRINVPLGEVASWSERGGERIFTTDASIAAVLVGDFMRAFGQAMSPKPTIPSDEVVRLRLRLIAEEFFELLAASFARSSTAHDLEQLEFAAMDIIVTAPINADLPALCDALADLDYVIEGTRLACGVNGKAIAEAVHRANMAKLGGGVDANGKVRKPEGWAPPDVKALLVEQGWEP